MLSRMSLRRPKDSPHISWTQQGLMPAQGARRILSTDLRRIISCRARPAILFSAARDCQDACGSLSRHTRGRGARVARMSERAPVTDWLTDWDHLDPKWVENPFPIWDGIRASQCPIAHTERFRGAYLPTRYEDIRAIA